MHSNNKNSSKLHNDSPKAGAHDRSMSAIKEEWSVKGNFEMQKWEKQYEFLAWCLPKESRTYRTWKIRNGFSTNSYRENVGQVHEKIHKVGGPSSMIEDKNITNVRHI